MSYLPSFLRSAAVAATVLCLSPAPFVTGSATLAIVTVATVTTTSQAEARPRVRDHRCLPEAHRKPKCSMGR
jgi:hypothetical protein